MVGLSTQRRMMTIDGLQSVSMMHAGRLGVVGCTYLLRATFDADDQGFADAQVLDTVAEGVQDGQLTVVEVDGTLAIVGNECAFTAQGGTPDWGDQGMYSQEVARALGRTLFGIVVVGNTEEWMLQWQAAGSVDWDTADFNSWIRLNELHYLLPDATNALLVKLAAATEYQLALVLGGYDVNGVPWHEGETPADYKYGCTLFIKGGTFTDWTVVWREASGATAALYAAHSAYNMTGTLDSFRVPDADLSAVLEPLVKDTFTDANGTSLDAHDPDVDAEAGGWTEHAGNLDIQGNKANVVTGSAPATIDTGEADVVLVCDIDPIDATVFEGSVVRLTDSTHFWLARWEQDSNVFSLIEVNGGFTTRASVADACASPPQAYRVVMIANGQTITAYRDGGSRITYGSAALNETVTRHGIRGYDAGSTFDNFHVHALRAAIYDTTFDAV